MDTDKHMFSLAAVEEDDPAPVLTGVHASGHLDGVLFELTVRQTYCNTSRRTLEVLYTFPLPLQATLLGFAAELGGERQVGVIVARPDAERQYEEALSEGHAPVMLEALGEGLHTANIGNLKPGDEMVLEVRFAQVLAFEQGRLRLAIPATIAPRYGRAEAAGLQPQQVPAVSPVAAYPLAVSLTVGGALAGAVLECPTHRVTQQKIDGAVRLDVAQDAWLDRDVVIVVTPREPLPCLVVRAADRFTSSAPVVTMAALQPPRSAPRERIALKLLVDCSGSMGGDSIASARAALRGVLAHLGPRDEVSLSRFGSSVEHAMRPARATPHVVSHLKEHVDGLAADLGGTEMEDALRAVFALPVSSADDGADVLLVTDGEIWHAAELIAAARASGHRVFAIGVGSSPAEGVLRPLAEATGGACEFATAGEALEAAAARMMARIRQQPWRNVAIDWGVRPVWQTTLPANVFGGDTVIAFAGMAAAPATSKVRMMATDATGLVHELAHGEADASCADDALARIAAARRMATLEPAEALELALAYQLMSPQTHCILVHRREEADKPLEPAELHRVDSMLAAGWGASSTVLQHRAAPASAVLMDAVHLSLHDGVDLSEAVSPYVCAALQDDADPATLDALAHLVAEHLAQGGNLRDLPARCRAMELHASVDEALEQMARAGCGDADAILVLAHWVNARTDGLGSAAIAATLRPHLDMLDASVVRRCMAVLDRCLGGYPNDSWTTSRTRRLRAAMTRST